MVAELKLENDLRVIKPAAITRQISAKQKITVSGELKAPKTAVTTRLSVTCRRDGITQTNQGHSAFILFSYANACLLLNTHERKCKMAPPMRHILNTTREYLPIYLY